MPPTRAARIERVLAAVPAEDVDWVAAQLLTPREQQLRRTSARDAAALACFALLDELPTRVARYIQVALDAYLASAAWTMERAGRQPVPPATPFAAAIRTLARANDGEVLGVRSLLAIRARAENSPSGCTTDAAYTGHGIDN